MPRASARCCAGGGSRGLAHLGILQAIRETGVPVDVVGGTSQGAFMAALFAQGWEQEELTKRVRTYAKKMASVRHLLSDVTLPILSLFSGHQFDRVRALLAASWRFSVQHSCAACLIAWQPMRLCVPP